MPEQNLEVEVEKKQGGAQSVVKEILSWVIPFASALVVALLLKNYVIINADIPTGSMENTIMPGDRLGLRRIILRKSGRWQRAIIIFRFPRIPT